MFIRQRPGPQSAQLPSQALQQICEFSVEVSKDELIPHHFGKPPRSHVGATAAARIAIGIDGAPRQKRRDRHGRFSPATDVLGELAVHDAALGAVDDAAGDASKRFPDDGRRFGHASGILAGQGEEGVVPLAASRVGIREAELVGDGVAIDGVAKGQGAGCEAARELFARQRPDGGSSKDGVGVGIDGAGRGPVDQLMLMIGRSRRVRGEGFRGRILRTFDLLVGFGVDIVVPMRHDLFRGAHHRTAVSTHAVLLRASWRPRRELGDGLFGEADGAADTSSIIAVGGEGPLSGSCRTAVSLRRGCVGFVTFRSSCFMRRLRICRLHECIVPVDQVQGSPGGDWIVALGRRAWFVLPLWIFPPPISDQVADAG